MQCNMTGVNSVSVLQPLDLVRNKTPREVLLWENNQWHEFTDHFPTTACPGVLHSFRTAAIHQRLSLFLP